jgi:glycosyltransferase involved in cell wall biosynthesis
VPFFTSILTAEQMDRARRAARAKGLGRPLHVLYVGRLSAAKNVNVIVQAVARLHWEGTAVRCTILGDGPHRGGLESLVSELGLGGIVEFPGAVEFDRVLDYYERAHALVLASQTEGWPKAIAEAMAFGVVCVGSRRGIVPEMLGEGRGLVVPPRDDGALAAALRQVAASPDEYAAMSGLAAAWGQRHSREDLREAIRDLLSTWWGVSFNTDRNCAAHTEPIPT